MNVLDRLAGGLIVSCQASEGEPLFGADVMARMAQAAALGGAVGIRAQGVDDVRAVALGVPLPVVGIWKIDAGPDDAFITVTLEQAEALAAAGAAIIGIDATNRRRPSGTTAAELISAIKAGTGLPLMADCATFDEAIAAAEAGADMVATTLSGYTPYTQAIDGPDLDLIRRLSRANVAPVVAEGRIWTPDDAVAAFDAGAWAVTVGTAITRPHLVTRRFVDRIEARRDRTG
jgi:N-acylglucosamine-6-phosphate 2-epimerase